MVLNKRRPILQAGTGWLMAKKVSGFKVRVAFGINDGESELR